MTNETQYVPKFVMAKDLIRKSVDPNELLITDEVIFKVLRTVGGDIQRATHKCILIMHAEAMQSKNGTAITLTRDLLRFHEAGLLLRD